MWTGRLAFSGTEQRLLVGRTGEVFAPSALGRSMSPGWLRACAAAEYNSGTVGEKSIGRITFISIPMIMIDTMKVYE